MHIVQALDLFEAQHGSDAPLPRFMQYASIIYALNRHYGVVAQYAYQEHIVMQNLITEETRYHESRSPKTLADHRQRFLDTVNWVAQFMDGSGRCKIWNGHEFHETDNTNRIVDYLSALCLLDKLAIGVTAAHVRAARNQVTGKRAS